MKTGKRFDYSAACAEIALPAARALPPAVLSIYRDLRDAPEFEGLAQARDLNVPMPESLRARFEAIDSDTLSRSAWALYHLGHWSGVLDAGTPDKRGATWKFANLADGVLRKRLNLPDLGAAKSIGYHFEVHEGALRLCASTPDSWMWLEIGPATAEFLEVARAWRYTLPGCPATRYLRSSKAWQAFEAGAYKATRAVPEALLAQLPEDWRRFVNACSLYMREPGKGSDDCPECGTQRLFKSDACNHAITCSRYPAENRADAALKHAGAFGLTEAQIAAARAAILGVQP